MPASPKQIHSRRKTFVRQEKERVRRTANRVRERNQKKGNSTVAEKGNLSDALDLLYRAPDHDWTPIPFTDADVAESELQQAKDRAVAAMTEWGVLVEASRASGIGRRCLYRHMEADPIFRERIKAAKKNNDERIEREMRRRGMLPKGELAAIFVMKHNIRKYREVQRLELSGPRGGPMLHAEVKSELLKKLEHLALKSQAVDAQVVGGSQQGPRLLKGSHDAEGVTEVRVKKASSKSFGQSKR